MTVSELLWENGRLTGLTLKSKLGKDEALSVSGLFVALGRLPDTHLESINANKNCSIDFRYPATMAVCSISPSVLSSKSKYHSELTKLSTKGAELICKIPLFPKRFFKKSIIEVKYREGAPIADDDAIVELCEESSAAIIITKNADDYGVHNTKCGKDLLRIPAFAFLYLLGNAEKHGYRGMEQ